MKKNLTEIVFILDRSGSMSGLEADTIGGFNSLLEKQKSEKEKGDCIVSTMLFDDRREILHDRVTLDDIRPLTDKDYYVRGWTALLDAMGEAINHIRSVHKNLKDDKRPDKTMFIITTDGMENASSEYSYKDIKKLVEKQKKKHGWEFLFLGANIDAIEVAESVGISSDRAVNYKCDSVGTELNYRVLSTAVSKVRACACCDTEPMLSPEWKEEIEADYCKRG